MGNIGSNSSNARRRHGGGENRRGNNQNHPTPSSPPPQQPPPETTANRYVLAAISNHPNPNLPPPPYYQNPTGVYYPPPPPLSPVAPLPAPAWVGGRYPHLPVMHHPAPYVDHQKATTIRNDVNLKKETLKIEPDEEHRGKFLVEFAYDANVAGSITLYFFAKEEDSNITPTKEDTFPPIKVDFQQGLRQRFRQDSMTGINLSKFEESEVTKVSETGVYPLVIKAEATTYTTEDHKFSNSQITHAVFENDKGAYRVRVVKQILWMNGMRYELQEIYGIGNSVDATADFDPCKECVICLSEPRDTTVLPCRHMCLCSGCAKVLGFQTNRCPICRQPVERLLEIKVNNATED